MDVKGNGTLLPRILGAAEDIYQTLWRRGRLAVFAQDRDCQVHQGQGRFFYPDTHGSYGVDSLYTWSNGTVWRVTSRPTYGACDLWSGDVGACPWLIDVHRCRRVEPSEFQRT